MNHLVLHFDAEFIVGIVCAGNGALYPITNGREELLWLYFFNNPHQNSISFGKANKSHFNNLEINYYGRFFEKIEKDQETFTLRGIEHPIIDLLKECGLIEAIKNTYQQKTLETNISTLMTFSTSIGDSAKQKTVEYFKKQGFQIDSYTIPLAELTCYYSLKEKPLKSGNGSAAIFLEATNSSLHVMKLSHIDNYYLLDGKPISWRGKGVDPRKRALARFIVNEVNNATGILSKEDEKEDECERLETYADEWLKRLDVQTRNMPLRIPSISFTKAPNMRKDVMVRKDDLDSDTGQYTQDIRDIFEAFKKDNISSDVAAVFLLGNCFQSERVRGCFEQMMSKEKLHFYANKDIRDILAMYPKIDINRYASEEARIKERAKAEELKQAEQRAFEDQQRKEAEAEANRQAAVFKTEQDRKEAQNLFERAVELDREGKLEDARINAENALLLNSNNKEYREFISIITEKIKILNGKNELYKSYLNKAEKFLRNNDLGKALDEYQAARYVFDNAEIIKKINEVTRSIKEQDQKIKDLLKLADSEYEKENWEKAKEVFQEIIKIRPENKLSKEKIEKCQHYFEIGLLTKKADELFLKKQYKDAQNEYRLGRDNPYSIKKCEDCARILSNQRSIKNIMIEGKYLIANKKYEKLKVKFIELRKLVQEIKLADPTNDQNDLDIETYQRYLDQNIEKPVGKTKVQKTEIKPKIVEVIPSSNSSNKMTENSPTSFTSEAEKLFFSGRFIEAKQRFESAPLTDIIQNRIKICDELRKYEKQIRAFVSESRTIISKLDLNKAKTRSEELKEIEKIYISRSINDERIKEINLLYQKLKNQ